MSNKTFTYGLYAVLALLLIYFIYANYIKSDESDDEDDLEEFDNNSSVRSDYGDDRSFDKLSLRDKVNYIKDKQEKIMERFSLNVRQRNGLISNQPY